LYYRGTVGVNGEAVGEIVVGEEEDRFKNVGEEGEAVAKVPW
jgi:hypothetical protein